MSVSRTIFAFILMTLLLPISTLPAALAAKPGALPGKQEAMLPVTLIHQETNTFGSIDLYICDSAARFVARKGDITIATRAPSWDIVLYSKSKNQGLVTDYAEAARSSLGVFTFPLSLSHSKAKPFDNQRLRVKVLKIVATPYEYTTSSDAVIFQNRGTRVVLDTVIETAELCKITPQLQRYLDWLYNFKKYSGIPLEMSTHFKGGLSELGYHTTSIEHVTRPASFFTYPTGFKPAKNRMDVLLSDDATTTLEDLWGSPREAVKHK